ncbi:MAG: DUF4445 domain-containing protein [Clostridia bacterium]|nr:DUF4445 domain-containing protein [Clostridia bacterium]
MPVLTVRQGARRHEIPFSPGACLGDLLHAFDHPHPCGGRGVCGKCSVLMSGQDAPVLSCQTYLGDQDAEVYLPEAIPLTQIAMTGEAAQQAAPEGAVGAAVDIGTTTIALALYDLHTGGRLAEAAMINPQTAVAADVIGRIGAALEGRLSEQERLVRGAIAALLRRACDQAGLDEARVTERVITGNTTMLYLLTGQNPVSLSRAPFKADTLFGHPHEAGYLPPCMNAFVGADITCAALACGLCESSSPALLCDLGTNGELALWKDGRLYVTSTAAGPVFEGACISCGVSSIPGAIDRVHAVGGRLHIHTIGDQPAVGVCGSGLLDAVAALLEIGAIDETGLLEDAPYPLAPGVFLTQADVRAVQLAKAAIYAGVRTLLRAAKIAPGDVKRFFVAGGFGSHAGMGSAAVIGMLPRELAAKAQAVGNAALRGAAALLLSPKKRAEAQRIAAQAVHVPLGGDPGFNDAYIEAMMFDTDEEC